MITIDIKEFGGFANAAFTIEYLRAPNGAGKTSLLNAYVWCLTGKTLNGFTARRIYAGTNPTKVTIKGLFGTALKTITRTLDARGRTYIVNDLEEILTQADLNATLMRLHGAPIELIYACANVNVLTDSKLTADDLRKILANADILDGEELKELKRDRKKVQDKITQANLYANRDVVVPEETVRRLNLTEIGIISRFERADGVLSRGINKSCTSCGATFSKEYLDALEHEYKEAEQLIRDYEDEVKEVLERKRQYDVEQHTIEDCKRLVEAGKKALQNAANLRFDLKVIDSKIKELESSFVRAELPEGVDIITEVQQKNGEIKNTCQLTYNGIPLKSVNRAKQIEICVELLDLARCKKGLREIIPIIIDNAESVTGLQHVDNVIRFEVG